MKANKKKNNPNTKKKSKLLSNTVASKKNGFKKILTLWFDNADAKMVLNISDSTLTRLRKNGKIPYTKVGNKYYYPRAYFEQTMLIQVRNKHLISKP